MFNFIKNKLHKIYTSVTTHLHTIFTKQSIDQATIDELYQILIQADTGVTTTKKLIEQIKDAHKKGDLKTGHDIQTLIKQELTQILNAPTPIKPCQVYLLVGINGSGKTTFCGKLANYLKKQNKSILLAAADTFRAAAPQQLQNWALSSNVDIILGKPGQDPASITFEACESIKKNNHDILIVDTAGRLQTKENLMKELEKIKKTILKQIPNSSICTLLTIDSMLGQNSLSQAKIFNESTNLNGIVLTKLDGTAKGGIVFAIVQELNIPIAFLSWGEHIDDMTPFNTQDYINNLLETESTFHSHKNKP